MHKSPKDQLVSLSLYSLSQNCVIVMLLHIHDNDCDIRYVNKQTKVIHGLVNETKSSNYSHKLLCSRYSRHEEVPVARVA